ncbi:MAG TPA: DUF72 domain-containing protein [Nitrospiraceae bacterium]|nr:DUF72 domain-containing protein [Nitrospiraceae bacterium]
MARVLIGTSGWTYSNWRGPFYPVDLPSRRYLEFYSKQFPTTEVNYSFYHLPRLQTYANWASQVPDGFVFAVKASRLITHTKRLSRVEEPWRAFVQNAVTLGAHLGPILLQFPPSLQKDRHRLAEFLKDAQGASAGQARLRLVFEFRHESWFTDEIYRVLGRHGAALCIADSPNYPRHDVLTTDFTYVRFHGRIQLFASSYSKTELAEEARKINRYVQNGVEVFVYFNNDARGHAINNARTLRMMLEK